MQISQHKTGFTRTLEASSVSSRSERGFTTTSEGENEGLPSFFPSAVGAKARSAFTLIELLVVIAIISLLSSVVLASLSGARESAKVTRIVSDFKQLETGMTMWMQAEGETEWPLENTYSSPNLKTVANESSLSEYLTTIPQPPFGDHYWYDNDGDVYTSCETGAAGMNIYVGDVPPDIASDIDQIIDSSDGLNCGRLRQDSNDTLIYTLSGDASF